MQCGISRLSHVTNYRYLQAMLISLYAMLCNARRLPSWIDQQAIAFHAGQCAVEGLSLLQMFKLRCGVACNVAESRRIAFVINARGQLGSIMPKRVQYSSRV